MKSYNKFINEELSIRDQMKPKSDDDIRNNLSKLNPYDRINKIKEKGLDASYMPSDEEIHSLPATKLISLINANKIDKKFFPPDDKISSIPTRQLLDLIDSGKVDKKHYPSDAKIKQYLSIHSFLDQIKIIKNRKLNKDLISKDDINQHLRRLSLENRIGRVIELGLPIESIILDVNNEKYSSLLQKYIFLSLFNYPKKYLPTLEEIQSDLKDINYVDLKEIINSLIKNIKRIKSYKEKTHVSQIKDIYSFIPSKLKTLIESVMLNKIQDSSVDECKNILRKLKRYGVNVEMKNVFNTIMDDSDMDLNIFKITPYHLQCNGSDIEVYTQKEYDALEKILSRYHYVYDGGYRKEVQLLSPKAVKEKFAKVIQFEDKKEEEPKAD